MASALSSWLATLPESELATVLSRRPEALRGPEPRSLGELAERLQHQASVLEALTTLQLPCLQVVEALLSLGGEPTRDALAELIGADADPVLAQLRATALVWTDGDRLRFAGALRNAFPDPLGLGRPARVLLSDRTVAELQRLQSALDLPGKGGKRALIEAIVARLSDIPFVRARIAALPDRARRYLDQLAAQDQDVDELDVLDEVDYDLEQLLAERGLLIQARWGPVAYLPAEVARALRGEQFRAPFAPDPPSVDTIEVGVDAVQSEAGVRAAELAEHAATLLELVAAAPVTVLKTGGIGTRELTRLAKGSGTSITLTRLIVELAGAAGLVNARGEQAMVTAAYDEWREHGPARRLAPLVTAWWQYAGTPTTARDEDGKALPALGGWPTCEGCQVGRHVLIATAAEASPGRGARDVDQVADAAWWHRPTAHLPREAGSPLAWDEAEALGVLARGAVSGIGRALLAGGSVEAALDELLPAATTAAAFGSDLTVVVSGPPSTQVRTLLDLAADREARGAATVWRFTPASVRRALDTGTTAAQLEAELAAIAAADLPQPLRYLIGDVARRHGRLRVAAAACCVHSQDEALLAEVVAHRSLRKLGLRLLAPTVALCGSSVPDTIAALRAAGYLPLAESADGTLKLERTRRRRAAPSRRPVPARTARPGPPADPVTLARRLLTQPAVPAPEPKRSRTEATVAEWATGLDSAQVRQLAHAVDARRPIRIQYEAASGGFSNRVVSELTLEPPFLVGWCHLREAERMFTLSRILSATAV